ncbi:MFS transporter [Meiothermus hypogaeus]|uniref:MFS transporter n=2 Tax=Meiothermus hypogaeus TaxID=884155 RepID=A0A511R5S2_9DEIN|nr:MFS transporter [Meiothermus hypogaeus]RIH80343.1 Tetracycline resistance protein, class C [Meiothermus hypogaeus]GEM84272.1 MFS transporter [Meiothermus hypogaeus NBRC 106114]GIW36087.1 MAG: MFS transporter [Meiothermus sp.]
MTPLSLLFLTLFNSILGLSVLFPILGPLARELGLSEVQVGLFSTGYALMQFVLAAYWGRRSEVMGRKPILLMGIVGFAVSFFLFAFFAWLGYQKVLLGWGLFAAMLFSRLLGGAFSSATLPTAQAYLADITPREERTQSFAILGAAFGLGVIFGPAIGAGLSHFGLLAPVVFSASLALLNALFVWVVLPESRKAEARPSSPPQLSWADPRILPLLLIGLSINLASIAMEQTVAFLYQDRLLLSPARTAQAVGIALVVFGVVGVLVQGVWVRAVKWPPRKLLMLGMPLLLLGYLGLMFASSFAWLTASLMLLGLGSMTSPGLTAAQSLAVSDDEQGAVAGLSSAAQALGRMLGPVVGTSLYGLSPAYPYVFSALLIGLALVFFLSRPQLASAR